MNEIDPRRKRPATVTTYDARPVILMTAPYVRKADLTTAVNRLTRRGEVRPLGQGGPIYNPGTGLWEIEVLRLREPAPAWIKPTLIIGGILVALAVFLGLAWWVLTTLTTGALLTFLAAVLLSLAGLARASRPQTVNITQNVRIR